MYASCVWLSHFCGRQGPAPRVSIDWVRQGGKSLNMTTAAWTPQASLATRRGAQRPCEWTSGVGRGKSCGLPRGPSAPPHANGGRGGWIGKKKKIQFFFFSFFLSLFSILRLRFRPPPTCGGCGPICGGREQTKGVLEWKTKKKKRKTEEAKSFFRIGKTTVDDDDVGAEDWPVAKGKEAPLRRMRHPFTADVVEVGLGFGQLGFDSIL